MGHVYSRVDNVFFNLKLCHSKLRKRELREWKINYKNYVRRISRDYRRYYYHELSKADSFRDKTID